MTILKPARATFYYDLLWKYYRHISCFRHFFKLFLKVDLHREVGQNENGRAVWNPFTCTWREWKWQDSATVTNHVLPKQNNWQETRSFVFFPKLPMKIKTNPPSKHSCNSLSTGVKKAEFANSVDLDEVAHHEPPHLDLHCLASNFWILNMIYHRLDIF